jgi:hypothetical protein
MMVTFRERLSRSAEKAREDRRIRDAVLADAAGKSRDEVRDRYVAELRARGRPVPGQPWLDVAVDTMVTGGTAGGRAQVLAQGMRALGGTVAWAKRTIDGEGRSRPTWSADGKRTAEVQMDDGVGRWVGELPAESIFEFRGMSQLRAEVTRAEESLVVGIDGRRVGVVLGDDAGDVVAEQSPVAEVGESFGAMVSRYRTADGEWRLYLHFPRRSPLPLWPSPVAFPFPGDRFPDELRVLAQTTVGNGEAVIRLVLHTAGNFWSAEEITDPSERSITPGSHQVVPMSELLDRDPSLAELATLPEGYLARRSSPKDRWTIEEMED